MRFPSNAIAFSLKSVHCSQSFSNILYILICQICLQVSQAQSNVDPLFLVFVQFVAPHSIPKIYFHLEIDIKGQQVSKTSFSQTSKTFVRGCRFSQNLGTVCVSLKSKPNEHLFAAALYLSSSRPSLQSVGILIKIQKIPNIQSSFSIKLCKMQCKYEVQCIKCFICRKISFILVA